MHVYYAAHTRTAHFGIIVQNGIVVNLAHIRMALLPAGYYRLVYFGINYCM